MWRLKYDWGSTQHSGCFASSMELAISAFGDYVNPIYPNTILNYNIEYLNSETKLILQIKGKKLIEFFLHDMKTKCRPIFT